MGRKKKVSKKDKSDLGAAVEEELKKFPHSLVFQRGNVGKNISSLVTDMRRVMEPFTGSRLKVRRKNHLKDFVSVAGPLNISHFLTFTKTEMASYLRVMRLPRGPTLTFRIQTYSLSRDVVSSMKRHSMDQKQFQHHPLLVMNNFSGHGMHLKLMTTMFQNLFPSINVNKINLSNVRRCVLLSYNQQNNTLDFRHYSIKAVPVGMSRSVKKLVKAQVPDMGRLEDISEYMLRAGDLSESEAELDGADTEVVLPQSLSSRGNMKAAKSAIRLTEIGPRLCLELVKIEEGLCEGEVLYHSLVTKSPEEKAALASRRRQKKKLRESRKQQQQENVRRKEERKEEQRQRCLAGMKAVDEPHEYEEVDSNVTGPAESRGAADDDSEEDNAAYYRAEVGEDPDPDLFPQRSKAQKRKFSGDRQHHKKPKTDSSKTHDKGKSSKKRTTLTEIDRIKRRKSKKLQQKRKKMVKRNTGNHPRKMKG